MSSGSSAPASAVEPTRSQNITVSWRRSASAAGVPGGRTPLSANMRETATPWKFSVEGEQGLEDDERTGTSPRWTGDRGDGEGDTAAVHARVQAEDRP